MCAARAILTCRRADEALADSFQNVLLGLDWAVIWRCCASQAVAISFLQCGGVCVIMLLAASAGCEGMIGYVWMMRLKECQDKMIVVTDFTVVSLLWMTGVRRCFNPND